MEWAKTLWEKAKSTFSPPPPPPPRHVSWEEAFQLDPALDKNPSLKAKRITYLKEWESTKAGQQELTAYVEAKSRIPNGHVWEDPYREHNLGSRNPLVVAAQTESDAIKKRHTDPKRIFLYFVPEEREKWTAFDKFGHNGYEPNEHRLQINLGILSWPSQFLPKVVDGKKAEAQGHPLQPIQHEIRHATDALNRKFAKNIAGVQIPTTKECNETRGVEAENRLLQELGHPLRYAYNDPLFALQRTYPKGQVLSAEDYHALRKTLAYNLAVDTIKCDLENFSGIIGGTPKLSGNGALIKIYQAADAMLKDHGITVTPSENTSPAPAGRAPQTPPRRH